MVYPRVHNKRYNNYSNYVRTIFPGRTQKLSINAGFTCPNRDGTKGRGGCTYCNNDAFKPDYCIAPKSVTQQIEEGIAFFSGRKKPDQYLAYFQAYSNTYDSIERLEQLYHEALNVPLVKGLVVATRPDCIDEEKIALLEELAKNHYVAVEYGVESCNEDTLLRINRCHTFEKSKQTIYMTANRGIDIGVHLILGLPGETEEIMLGHATQLSHLPVDTLKIHQLQIIKQTIMAKEYFDHPEDFGFFKTDDYITLVCDFLSQLRPDIVIERFVSQSPKNLLIHPRWGLKNFEITHKIEKRLQELDTWQGKMYK